MINLNLKLLEHEIKVLIELLNKEGGVPYLKEKVEIIKSLTDKICEEGSAEEKINASLQMGFILVCPFISILPLSTSNFASYLANDYFKKARELTNKTNLQINNLLDIADFFVKLAETNTKIAHEHLLKLQLNRLKNTRKNRSYETHIDLKGSELKEAKIFKAMEITHQYKHLFKEQDLLKRPLIVLLVLRIYLELLRDLENFYSNKLKEQFDFSLKNPFFKEAKDLESYFLFWEDIKRLVRNLLVDTSSLTPELALLTRPHEAEGRNSYLVAINEARRAMEKDHQHRFEEMLALKNDFFRRRHAQLISKKLKAAKVDSGSLKPKRNKKNHQKSLTSGAEEVAYDLFKRGKYEAAIKQWNSLLQKVSSKDRLKQIEINATIADCYGFWAENVEERCIDLEDKAREHYSLALKQITAGLNQCPQNEKLLVWSDFIHMALNSLKPQNYFIDLNEIISKEDLALEDASSSDLLSADDSKFSELSAANKRKEKKAKATEENEVSLISLKEFIPVLSTTAMPTASSAEPLADKEIVDCVKNSIKPLIHRIINTLHERGHRCYIVGGAVRDALLHKKSADVDLVSTALPEEIWEIAHQLGENVQIFGPRKPIARIEGSSGNDDHYDFAILQGLNNPENRCYLKLDNDRIVSIFYGTDIHIDAMNRDSPVNSIYLDLLTNRIEDPTAQGRDDLRCKLLRTIDDPERSFAIDPGRMLRFVRLKEKLHFSLEEKTRIAIKNNAHLLASIPPLRFLQELYKLLISDNGRECINSLNELGLLSLFMTGQGHINLMRAILEKIAVRKLPENNAWLLILAGLFWPGSQQRDLIEQKKDSLIQKIDNRLTQFANFLWISNLKAKIKEIWLQSIDNTQQLTSLSFEEFTVVNLFEELINQPSSFNPIALPHYGGNFFAKDHRESLTNSTSTLGLRPFMKG